VIFVIRFDVTLEVASKTEERKLEVFSVAVFSGVTKAANSASEKFKKA